MNNEWELGNARALERQYGGIVRAMSDWVELEDPHDTGASARTSARTSAKLGGAYGIRLMNLHTAKRILMVRIEDAQQVGGSTTGLEAELEVKRKETRTFLEYLEAHAGVLV